MLEYLPGIQGIRFPSAAQKEESSKSLDVDVCPTPHQLASVPAQKGTRTDTLRGKQGAGILVLFATSE